MHEVGLVEDAIRRATATAAAAGSSKVERLTFALAPGGHVTAEAVEMLFRPMSAGTPVEGAYLSFEDLEVEYACWDCGNIFWNGHAEPEACPNCHATAVSRLDTPDLLLRYVDVPFIEN